MCLDHKKILDSAKYYEELRELDNPTPASELEGYYEDDEGNDVRDRD